MTQTKQPPANPARFTPDELVFMVAGDYENGDHHIFVSTDKSRAEARHQVMLAEFTNVKANWQEKN